MLENFKSTALEVEGPYDLTNCDREPIHIPGAIQPHGLLIHLDPIDLSIVQISANVSEFSSFEATALLGQCLSTLLDAESFDLIARAMKLADIKEANPIPTRILGEESQFYDGILHEHQGAVILEMEVTQTSEGSLYAFYQIVRQAVRALQNASSIAEACTAVSREIRKITGFGRVTTYRFDDDWNGNVVGEDLSDEMESLLGQRFPASDIPAQARALYQVNWMRSIADRTYVPSPIIPSFNPRTGKPLDLSLAFLRSVSPVHLEYMANMKMMASTSVSIMKGGKLWGLISCHHKSPKCVSFPVRSACEFLGEVFSGQMAAIETREATIQQRALQDVLSSLDDSLSSVADFASALGVGGRILAITNACGAALLLRGRLTLYGMTPEEAEVASLIAWLNQQKSDMFHARSLQQVYPAGKSISETASGLLSLRIARNPDSFLIWFRPEKVRAIDWAGNPSKPVETIGGVSRLHPRKSFELWREIVKGQAEPFTDVEIQAADAFKTILLAKLLAVSVRQLESSNLELDSFAQMVSHDLREPLRGIRIYARHSLEDDRDAISEGTRQRLGSMIKLSQDLDELLLSLYNFSKLGRVDLSFETSAIHEILGQIIERLRPIFLEQNVEVVITGQWPTLFCDRVSVGEIFQNLILNAVRYHDKPSRKITLDARRSDSNDDIHVFSVSDNGIGIDASYFQDIFQLFKRLHSKEEFPGGTGSGLTMTRRLVEKHGGKIWLDSVEGEGTTFFFTLQPYDGS